MYRPLIRLAKLYPTRAVVIVVLSAAIAWLSTVETTRWVEWRRFETRVEQLGQRARLEHGRQLVVPFMFDAFGERHTVYLPVDTAELETFRMLPAEDAFRYRGRWRARYVRSLVGAQAQTTFIDDLAGCMRDLAIERRLDYDEYLELLVAAVQSMRYDFPDEGVRTPIEVMTEREGICTERSLLLASLLVHEGYDTVMWSFETQHHVALGVATDGPSFRDSGYAFIETTKPAYIGQADPVYLGQGPVYRAPERVALGGGRRYNAGVQSAYILAVLESSMRRSSRLAEYSDHAEGATRHRDTYAHSADLYEQATRTVNFIIENVGDRPAVYEALCAGLPVES